MLHRVGDFGEVASGFGGCAGDLLRQNRGAHTAAARCVQRILHRHVVVDHDRSDLDALIGRVFSRQLEVEHVARVVLDDVHDAGAPVHRFRGRQHLSWHR